MNILPRRVRRTESPRHDRRHPAPVPETAHAPDPDTVVFTPMPEDPAPFTGASLEPLPDRTPGAFLPELPAPLAVPVMTEDELATLARVADRLRPPAAAEQDEPEPDEDDLPPSAWMRSWQHDGAVLPVALWGRPSFAGIIAGHGLAGLYLGDPDDEGRFAVDADVEYLDELIAVAQRARDALAHQGFGRAVPAGVNGAGQ